MLDGRHTGTGGGNHIVMGGITPTDSPFLRRPDLLASIIAYWQNHPSLSYLFSGLFIGPTSQAPRLDEARHEALLRAGNRAEADPRPGARQRPAVARRPHLPPPAGRRDRQHAPRRDLHRQTLFARQRDRAAWACIEFRSFEMPPHARMSVVQQLLMRALVAMFWDQPLPRQARPLGHGAARPLHAPTFPVDGLHAR